MTKVRFIFTQDYQQHTFVAYTLLVFKSRTYFNSSKLTEALDCGLDRYKQKHTYLNLTAVLKNVILMVNIPQEATTLSNQLKYRHQRFVISLINIINTNHHEQIRYKDND